MVTVGIAVFDVNAIGPAVVGSAVAAFAAPPMAAYAVPIAVAVKRVAVSFAFVVQPPWTIWSSSHCYCLIVSTIAQSLVSHSPGRCQHSRICAAHL